MWKIQDHFAQRSMFSDFSFCNKPKNIVRGTHNVETPLQDVFEINNNKINNKKFHGSQLRLKPRNSDHDINFPGDHLYGKKSPYYLSFTHDSNTFNILLNLTSSKVLKPSIIQRKT